ncbi:oligosaccharide flippase family protein [Fervidobacterium sp.]
MDSGLKDRFLKSYFSFSLGIWFSAIISFLSVPITSWLIEPSEYGKATMFSTIYSVVLLIVLVGTPNGFMRLYHSVEDKRKLLWSSLVMPVFLTVIFFGFVLLVENSLNIFLAAQKNSKAHLILVFAVFFGVLQTFNQTVLRMQEKGFFYSALQIANTASNALFVILYALLISRNFYALVYAQLFSNIFTLSFGIYLQRERWFPIKIDKRLVKEILGYSYPFLLSGIVWWLFGWTDRIVLRMYSTFEEIGLYSAAFKLISVMSLFTSGFSTFWYPFAYEQYEKNPNNKELFSKTFDYVSFLVLILALLIMSAKNVIFLLFAKSYRSSAYIAPFLLLQPVSLTMAIVVARGIDFAKKTYWYIISDGVAAAFNIIGNLLLIPLLGAKGAAITTGLSSIIVFAIEKAASERFYPVKYNSKRAYVSMLVLIIIASINTFFEGVYVGVLSSLTGIFVVILLYDDVFRNLMKTFSEILNRLERAHK